MTGLDLLRESGAIVAALESPEGMDSDECDSRLASWFDVQADKLGAYHFVAKRLDAEDEILKAVGDRIAAQRKYLARQKGHVRLFATELLLAKEALGEEPKVKRPEFTAWLQAAESVEGPEDPEDWPEEFRRTKVIVEADRAGAAKALKAGRELPGITLKSSRSVRWR